MWCWKPNPGPLLEWPMLFPMSDLSILPLNGIFVDNKLPFALASPVLWLSQEEGGGRAHHWAVFSRIYMRKWIQGNWYRPKGKTGNGETSGEKQSNHIKALVLPKILVMRSPNDRQHKQKRMSGLSYVKLLHSKGNIKVRRSEERAMFPRQHPSEMEKQSESVHHSDYRKPSQQ